MRKSLRVVALLIPMVFVASNSYAATKAGSPCPKLKNISMSNGKIYTCIKSGKKLVWDKGALITTAQLPSNPDESASPKPSESASPKATPSKGSDTNPIQVAMSAKAPTNFEDLYANRQGIAYAAWSKTAEVMRRSEAKVPPVKSFVGPSTKPWYSEVEKTIALVSKTFPSSKVPKNVLVLFYNYEDVSWAEGKLKTLISNQDYSDLNRNEGGHLVDSNCQSQILDCIGAKQVTTQDGTNSILLIGVSKSPGMEKTGNGNYGDPGTYENNTTGQLLAHEYFHAIQREEFVGKNLSQNDWPPAWVREGSAYFIQNAIINSGDFKKFWNWREIAVGDYIKNHGITADFVSDFMNLKHYSDNWNSFSGDWNYFLGARIIETLVSIKGPESIMSFYQSMGEKKGFETSFKNTFGANYQDVIPIIAKSVAENWKNKN